MISTRVPSAMHKNRGGTTVADHGCKFCPQEVSMKTIRSLILVSLFLFPLTAHGELPWQFDQHTRYMALGDSLVAGYGAVPATQGYVYLLYQSGTFDAVPNTLLSNTGVPGATSQHVLEHQVPQAIDAFQPTVITLTVGGNDLLRILNGADPQAVLSEFATNLTLILGQLRTALPNARIYVSNLYTVPLPVSNPQQVNAIVDMFNNIVAGVASGYGVAIADLYSAFLGKNGLLLIERHGANQFEVHPTNSGHRAIADAFKAAIH
jgi:lysophospholipase L1-like esterase